LAGLETGIRERRAFQSNVRNSGRDLIFQLWYDIMATKKTKKGRIEIDRELCKGCYLCVSVCPNELIRISEELNPKGYHPAEFVEADGTTPDPRCTGCAMCATVCPDVAIEVYRG